MRTLSRLGKALRGRSGRQLVKLTIYSLVCLAVLAGLVARIGNVDFFSDDEGYSAAMPDATGLLVNDEVKVAGVSVGLMTDAAWGGEARQLSSVPVQAVGGAGGAVAPAALGRYELLLDQLGMEDQLGDMDLKVAGEQQQQELQQQQQHTP